MLAPDHDHSISQPLVSVLMVARNAAGTIAEAIETALAQTVRDIEIVVVDDGSTDDTGRIVRCLAEVDGRIRLLPGPQAGLANVRNASFDAARGTWVAILDADDLIHPRHLEFLLESACDVDMAAANMVSFTEGSTRSARLFAGEEAWRHPRRISLEDFVLAGCLNTAGPSLGYLKPMIRRSVLRRFGIRYDPSLRIGEDYDLVERLLATGARYAFDPRPTYFYRRHAQSTSYRLGRSDLTAMIAAADRSTADEGPELRHASAKRLHSLEDAMLHLDQVEAIKSGRLSDAVRVAVRKPSSIAALAHSAWEGTWRRMAARLQRSGSHAGPAALVLGAPETGSRVAEAARWLQTCGYAVAHRSIDSCRAAAEVANGLRRPSIILLARPEELERAPFALAPDALVFGEGELCDGAMPVIRAIMASHA